MSLPESTAPAPPLVESILHGADCPDCLRDETIAQMFRATAAQYPAHPAIVFNGRILTYAELDRWTDAVAAYLNERGIARGKFVGLWWPRGIELHVAILGIVKSGAAYVPLDREMPAERVQVVLDEVGASACFSDGDPGLQCPILQVPEMPSKDVAVAVVAGPAPDNYAYVLYTSGSTGTPKGIAISQRNICHLIRSEQEVVGIKHEDRVYQGFSVSFDMWCEETWISYLVGATIFVADAPTAKSIDELGTVWKDWNITILHAVPSLLAVAEDEAPNLRLVNAGGEACTPQVVTKWARRGRLFLNSYGPTETTVTATMMPLQPGDPITIGNPLPNYDLAVVDEQMRPVQVGDRGELVISGPGVCDGYINRPDLTADKFLAKPVALAKMRGDRIYRSGDAVILNADGTIDFLGRLDDQIKLRGYRIELGEIETRLNALPGVDSAAVAVKKDGNDQDVLVGYVVMDEELHFDEFELRTELSKFLAPYMVPGVISRLYSMPRLPSGKIDRRGLPVPESLLQVTMDEGAEGIDTAAPLEDKVLTVLNKVFPNRAIDLSQDFFTDLGGHSLLAAVVVSRLRKEAGVPQASLKDIYLHRPLRALMDHWTANEKKEPAEPRVFTPVNKRSHLLCSIAQTLCLLPIYGAFAMQIFLPYIGYYYVYDRLTNHPYYEAHQGLAYAYSIATAFGLFAVMPIVFSVLSILVKKIVIGKFREGDYPLWGMYYFRWWLVKSVERLSPMQYLNGTPLYPAYLKMLGVNVPDTAQLSAMSIGAEDLVTIGADVSIASQAVINNAWVEDGLLKMRRVHIGDHAYLGSSAVVGGGATIEDWGELQDLSFLPGDKKILRGEVWNGSPAAKLYTRRDEDFYQPVEVSKATMRKYKFIFSLSLLVFPIFILLPLIPTIITLHQLDNDADPYDFRYLVITPSLALAYIILFALQTIVVTRLLQRNTKPGTYPLYSALYVKKWLADNLMSISLIVLHPIYATVYISHLFRALGARVGKNTEISTASSVTHSLLEIGSGSFIADAVTLGETDVRGQQLILERTKIGNTSFVGNSALIPQGYELPDNMLVGVLSTPPTQEQLDTSDAKAYFGSPAIGLPRRQESQAFDDRLTTIPPPHLRIARAVVELIRILIPETVIITLSVIFIAFGHDIVIGNDAEFYWRVIDVPWKFLVHLPQWLRITVGIPILYLLIIGIPAFLITVLLKWLVVGKYKAKNYPMYNQRVWRSEAITTTYEALAVPFFLEYLKGTFWLPFVMKFFGVKTGKRVWMNTTDITEYDMVTIGDEAMLNDDCGPQTHLFEDRVMKIGTVNMGAGCTIGARTIILYDSEVGKRVRLAPLSLVMKGEKLSDETDWTGSPVRNA